MTDRTFPLAKFSEATTPDAAVPSLKDLRFVHHAPSGGVQWIVRLASKESSSPTMPTDTLEVLTLPDRAIKISLNLEICDRLSRCNPTSPLGYKHKDACVLIKYNTIIVTRSWPTPHVDTRFQLRFQTEHDAATFVGLLKSACPHLSRTPAQSNALLQQTVQADSKRVKEVAIADNQTSRSEDDTTPGRALPTTFAHRMGLGEPYLPFGQPLRHDNRTWQYPELHDRSTGHFIKDKQRGSPLDRELGRNGPREYSPNVTGPPYGLGTSPHEPTAFIHQANDRPAPAFAVFQDAFNSSQPGNAADDDTTQYNLTQTRIPDLQALPDSYHPSPIRLPYIGDDTQESAGAASGHRSPARLAAFDSQATVEEEWTVAAKAATKVIPDGSSPAIIALATAVLTADTLGPGGGAGKAGGPKRGSPRASSPGAYDGQQDNKRARRSTSGRSSDITGARNIIASAQPARLHQLLSMPDNELSEVLHQMMQQRGFVELARRIGKLW